MNCSEFDQFGICHVLSNYEISVRLRCRLITRDGGIMR